jgi:hypothetical protein
VGGFRREPREGTRGCQCPPAWGVPILMVWLLGCRFQFILPLGLPPLPLGLLPSALSAKPPLLRASPFSVAPRPLGPAFLPRGLTPSQKIGVITLLFKGKGLPRDQPSSYRPITLLNTDYRILARALACRWGSAADAVVDQTQTAFIPSSWIGDNVLAHLEEVDFCHVCQVEASCSSTQPRRTIALMLAGSSDAWKRLVSGQTPGAGSRSFNLAGKAACGSTAGGQHPFPFPQGWHRVARCHHCCMSWLPNPTLPTSAASQTKAFYTESLCQMVPCPPLPPARGRPHGPCCVPCRRAGCHAGPHQAFL